MKTEAGKEKKYGRISKKSECISSDETLGSRLAQQPCAGGENAIR
jgi:hypothetical protein